MVHIDNKESSQQVHISILNYQDKQQESFFIDSKVYLKQIKSDAIYSDNHGPKENVVHIAHISILIYQNERQEILFVDSKDYSKKINSDAIYSDIRAPKNVH